MGSRDLVAEHRERGFNGAAGVNPRMVAGGRRQRFRIQRFNGAAGVNPRMGRFLEFRCVDKHRASMGPRV